VKRKREREKRKKKREKKRKGGIPGIQRALLLLLPLAMVEQDWITCKITQGHMQSLMNQWFIMAVEVAPCRVPEDRAFPTPAKGYMVTFVAFYERGLCGPLH
jgi:hypothetical protein